MSINQKNLQLLATEIFKAKDDLVLKTVKDIFHFIQNYAISEMTQNHKDGETLHCILEQKAYLNLPQNL